MIIDLNDMLFAFSFALDCVEHDVVGVTTNHGKRVAYMAVLMGKQLQMSQEDLMALAGLSVMHDNALSEYFRAEVEQQGKIPQDLLARHCIVGEKNISVMPFQGEHKNIILYHHENANGSGPFGKKANEIPLGAKLIHIADQVDAKWNLSTLDREKYEEVIQWVRERKDIIFCDVCVDCFMETLGYEQMAKMQGDALDGLVHNILPASFVDYSDRDIKGIAALFASITDYKSSFTRKHSVGIAEKAQMMGQYYGYVPQKVTKLYLAGALHDIGKLVVDQDILEKPDRLTEDEYAHIQNHAYYTYDLLRKVHGLEEVTKWSAFHHEKLNGTGYPFGLTGDKLGKEERLIACLDIYQALTEDRPYKNGFSHEKTIEILRIMAQKGQIDGGIVEDIDQVYGKK